MMVQAAAVSVNVAWITAIGTRAQPWRLGHFSYLSPASARSFRVGEPSRRLQPLLLSCRFCQPARRILTCSTRTPLFTQDEAVLRVKAGSIRRCGQRVQFGGEANTRSGTAQVLARQVRVLRWVVV
jgi:hypothetical protein